MVDEPNLWAASEMSRGFFTTAVFNATLSAPARRTWRISSSVLNPPATVSGTKVSEAVLSTMPRMLLRP